jgi:hypothetical protein
VLLQAQLLHASSMCCLQVITACFETDLLASFATNSLLQCMTATSSLLEVVVLDMQQ